jgi:hypothetical protein
MARDLEWMPDASRYILRLEDHDLRNEILDGLERISETSDPYKYLKHYVENLYWVKVSNHVVILEPDNGTIFVNMVLSESDFSGYTKA